MSARTEKANRGSCSATEVVEKCPQHQKCSATVSGHQGEDHHRAELRQEMVPTEKVSGSPVSDNPPAEALQRKNRKEEISGDENLCSGYCELLEELQADSGDERNIPGQERSLHKDILMVENDCPAEKVQNSPVSNNSPAEDLERKN